MSARTESLEVAPGPSDRQVRTADGSVLTVPDAWVLVPPGDAALTRRLKKAGPTWVVKEKRGRKMFSRGLWTDPEAVEKISYELKSERQDPAYQRKLDAGRKRREAEQERYQEDFVVEVERFLKFAPCYAALAKGLAHAITEQTIEVGSGTVARTKRIPVERRAEAATIAWMRHNTTEYDDLKIPRVKGMRREVRRLLAARSRELLARYRRGEHIEPADDTLSQALAP